MTYPDCYGTAEVTLEQMVAKYSPKMHPEMARRLFPWIESMGGLIGIGNGWRDKQPDRPGFAPDGQSFHQSQTWASGLVAYAAVDLVARAAPGNPNPAHRSPTWAEGATAPEFGLHTFVKVPDEPWHMQCIETRGWKSWVDDGRPDPQHFTLPGPTPPSEKADIDMIAVDYKPNTPQWTALMVTGTQMAWIFDGHADGVYRVAGVGRVTVGPEQLTGLIRSSQTTTDPPPTLSDSDRKLWVAQRGLTVTTDLLILPSRRADRWPLLIVAFGWFLLAILTFGGVAGRSGAGWGLIAVCIGAATSMLWWSPCPGVRKLVAASTVAFGAARSVDYLLDGSAGPIAVWIIVSGLALSTYRASVRQDRRT